MPMWMSALGYYIVTQTSFTVHTSWDDCEKSFSSMSNTWTLSQIAGTHDHLPEEDQYSNSVLNVLYSCCTPSGSFMPTRQTITFLFSPSSISYLGLHVCYRCFVFLDCFCVSHSDLIECPRTIPSIHTLLLRQLWSRS